VKLAGWAIETRVYAEDPARNFLPSVGRLVRYRPPPERRASGITVRNDTGVYEGGEISIFYDPMIAKLITHAPTREQATDAQIDALDAFTVDGVRHNLAFLCSLMAHPRWQSGKLSTAFLAEEFPDGFHATVAQGQERERVLAAVAAAMDHVAGERKRRISGQQPGRAVPRERRRVVLLGGREIKLELACASAVTQKEHRSSRGRPIAAKPDAAEPPPIQVRFIEPAGSQRHTLLSHWKPGDCVWSGTLDGRPIWVQVRPALNGFDLAHHGIEARAYVYTEHEAAAARLLPAKTVTDTGNAVRCPMPGLVISIAVAEGQDVKAGETLAVIEAMKMENVLRADRDGVVKKIHARTGDSLPVDAVILEFA
ncbi:MAG: biotin/lipoyl-binding protein, partial [Alphaproteobacteria bacterium]